MSKPTTTEMDTLLEGSATQWDSIWSDLGRSGSHRAKVFVRGRPRTIYQFWQQEYFRDLLDTIAPRRGDRMLELGSGRATTSLYLAHAGFRQITLVDLSPAALQQAVENFRSEGLDPPDMVVANALSTGLPPDSFDCIYNIGVLEHFLDPRPLLLEVHRLLAPGGKIFMPIVPAAPFAKSVLCRLLFNPLSLGKRLARLVLRRQPAKPTGDAMIRTDYPRGYYSSLCTELGFADVRCIPYNPYWKVNRDGAFLDRVVLPLYRTHAACKGLLGIRPRLKSLDAFSFCYLLTASKPAS